MHLDYETRDGLSAAPSTACFLFPFPSFSRIENQSTEKRGLPAVPRKTEHAAAPRYEAAFTPREPLSADTMVQRM